MRSQPPDGSQVKAEKCEQRRGENGLDVNAASDQPKLCDYNAIVDLFLSAI